MAAENEVTLFKNLDLYQDNFNCKAKVLKHWIQPDVNNPSEPFSTEMILLDEEGTKIQDNILKRWFTKFSHFTTDVADLLFLNPSLAENRCKFKYGVSPHKLSFYYGTKISKTSAISAPVFSFADYNDVLSCNLPAYLAIDLIGYVLHHTPIETFINKHGIQKQKLTVQIQNLEGKQLFVSLWDKFAVQFNDHLTNKPADRRLIIVLQFALLSYYDDKPSLSNYFDISTLHINNMEIDEVKHFKSKMLSSGASSLWSDEMTSVVSMGYSYEKDFLQITEFSNFAEIMACSEVKSFVVVGTVVGIDAKSAWFYLGCIKCRTKATNPDPEKDVYKCKGGSKCAGTVIKVVPKFKIPLRVQDPTRTVSCTLFDIEAFKFLGTTAGELYDKYEKTGDVNVVPSEFGVFVNKRFAMKVAVKTFNLENNVFVYSIVKLTSDEKIISELDNRNNVQESNASDPPNDNNEIRSANSNLSKDATSFTGENTTPSNVNVNSFEIASHVARQTHFNNETDFKRNLEAAYDVNDTSSAIKFPRVFKVLEDGTTVEVPKAVLVPKKEKE